MKITMRKKSNNFYYTEKKKILGWKKLTLLTPAGIVKKFKADRSTDIKA